MEGSKEHDGGTLDPTTSDLSHPPSTTIRVTASDHTGERVGDTQGLWASVLSVNPSLVRVAYHVAILTRDIWHSGGRLGARRAPQLTELTVAR